MGTHHFHSQFSWCLKIVTNSNITRWNSEDLCTSYFIQFEHLLAFCSNKRVLLTLFCCNIHLINFLLPTERWLRKEEKWDDTPKRGREEYIGKRIAWQYRTFGWFPPRCWFPNHIALTPLSSFFLRRYCMVSNIIAPSALSIRRHAANVSPIIAN